MSIMFQKEEIMEMCIMLAEHNNLRVTINQATKGALMVGCGALAGAILGGPIGLAVGGTAASISTAWRSRGSYKSVVDIIRYDFTPEQKNKLINAVQNQLSKVKPEDCVKVLTLVLSSASLKEVVIAEIGSFIMKEMKMQMIR